MQTENKILGKNLIFISRISSDGKSITDISNKIIIKENNTNFKLTSLSITHKTYIANEFNTYVVKLKTQ